MVMQPLPNQTGKIKIAEEDRRCICKLLQHGEKKFPWMIGTCLLASTDPDTAFEP